MGICRVHVRSKFQAAVIEAANKDRELVLHAKRGLGIKHRINDLTCEEAESIARVMELDIVFQGEDGKDTRQDVVKL